MIENAVINVSLIGIDERGREWKSTVNTKDIVFVWYDNNTNTTYIPQGAMQGNQVIKFSHYVRQKPYIVLTLIGREQEFFHLQIDAISSVESALINNSSARTSVRIANREFIVYETLTYIKKTIESKSQPKFDNYDFLTRKRKDSIIRNSLNADGDHKPSESCKLM